METFNEGERGGARLKVARCDEGKSMRVISDSFVHNAGTAKKRKSLGKSVKEQAMDFAIPKSYLRILLERRKFIV